MDKKKKEKLNEIEKKYKEKYFRNIGKKYCVGIFPIVCKYSKEKKKQSKTDI